MRSNASSAQTHHLSGQGNPAPVQTPAPVPGPAAGSTSPSSAVALSTLTSSKLSLAALRLSSHHRALAADARSRFTVDQDQSSAPRGHCARRTVRCGQPPAVCSALWPSTTKVLLPVDNKVSRHRACSCCGGSDVAGDGGAVTLPGPGPASVPRRRTCGNRLGLLCLGAAAAGWQEAPTTAEASSGEAASVRPHSSMTSP